MFTDSAERNAYEYDQRHKPTEPAGTHAWMSQSTNEFGGDHV